MGDVVAIALQCIIFPLFFEVDHKPKENAL
jgi:hypothetical protein